MTAEHEKINALLNDEDFTVPAGLPRPQLWRLVVAPVQPRKMSAGGLIIVDETQEAEENLAYIGKVLAAGRAVGKKPEWPEGAYEVKVGDWVIFGRYSGQRIQYRSLKLVLMDDTDVMALCDGPDGFRIYV